MVQAATSTRETEQPSDGYCPYKLINFNQVVPGCCPQQQLQGVTDSSWRSADKRPVALPFITGCVCLSHGDISVLLRLQGQHPGDTRGKLSFNRMAGRGFDPGDRLEVCPLGDLQIRPRYRPQETEQPSDGYCPYKIEQFQPGGAGVLPAATIAGGC
jgi:hypothetical protein